MAGAFKQDPLILTVSGSGTSTTSNPPGFPAVTAGSSILAIGTNDTGGAGDPSVADDDPTNLAAYTKLEDVTDTTDGQRFYVFCKENTSASAVRVITMTWTAAVAARGFGMAEISGSIAPGGIDKHVSNLQTAPTTGTDAVTSGSSGTLSKSPNFAVAISMDMSGSTAPATGTGWTSPNANYTGWATYGGVRMEGKNTSATTPIAGTFTAIANTIHITALVVFDDIGSSGGAVTTISDEAPPRRPPFQSTGDRQAEQWTLQPLGASQPIKSFLATEGMDRRPSSVPRHTSVPWTLTALATPTIKPWCDLAPPARVPPWARPRVLQPDVSMQPLGQSSPVRNFLHQHPAIAPPWRGPRPQQQPWVGAPIVASLPALLVNDEAQVVRPRRIRRWAPMGALARAAPSTESFPFAPDATGRFLVDSHGAPVPIIARTAWGIQSLGSSDLAEFLDDTVARGYTGIECQIPCNLAAIHNNPFDCNGNLPFNKLLDTSTWTTGSFSGSKPDLSTPNAAFWANVDNIVAACRTRKLWMVWFSAYLGIDSSEGWETTMTANGDPATIAYGAFVANRYKPQPNIVWGTAGDTASGFDEEDDHITGLQSVSGQRSGPQFTAERNGGSISSDGTGPLGAAMTINGGYDWPTVIAQCRRAYAFGTTTRAIPSFMIEGPYDEEGPDGNNINTIATQPVRRWPWWAIIETIGGFIQGNGYIWPFNPTGTPPATDNWKLHKNTQTTQDITRLAALWKSIAWWTLIPSGQSTMGTLITSGAGTPDNANYVASACNPAGSLWIAYAGPSRASTFTVDMTVMRGTATAQWWNPSTAAFTSAGSIANTGTHTFTVPGDNGTGFSDWVLVMTA
jgi:hypothetical protein